MNDTLFHFNSTSSPQYNVTTSQPVFDTVPVRPLYVNAILVIFGTIVTVVNAGLIYRMHTRRNFLKAKRYVFLVSLTCCDLAAGLVMVVLAIANAAGTDGPLVCLLQGNACLNLCLTMCSYTSSIVVQFIAVRYPIYYKTTVTKAKVIVVVVLSWLVSLSFSGVKLSYDVLRARDPERAKAFFYFPYIEVVFKLSFLTANSLCFVYVLIIAVTRRRQQQVSLEDSHNDRGYGKAKIENNEKEERAPFRKMAANYLRHYQGILTSGIRLLVYIVTCAPLTICCAYRVYTTDKNDAIFWESSNLGVSLILLWFCRSIFDPLITLIREKPVSRRSSTSTASSGLTKLTSRTSRLDSQRSESNEHKNIKV